MAPESACSMLCRALEMSNAARVAMAPPREWPASSGVEIQKWVDLGHANTLAAHHEQARIKIHVAISMMDLPCPLLSLHILGTWDPCVRIAQTFRAIQAEMPPCWPASLIGMG